MDFRDFTDHLRGSTEAIAANAGDRPITPFVVFASDEMGVNIVGVDPAFFDEQHPDRRRELVERFVVPLIEERAPQLVGWSFSATVRALGDDRGIDALIAVAIDRERHETWLMRDGRWQQLPPNEQAGRLLTPIQEALR